MRAPVRRWANSVSSVSLGGAMPLSVLSERGNRGHGGGSNGEDPPPPRRAGRILRRSLWGLGTLAFFAVSLALTSPRINSRDPGALERFKRGRSAGGPIVIREVVGPAKPSPGDRANVHPASEPSTGPRHVTSTSGVGASAGSCPNPRTCPHFTSKTGRWPMQGGRNRIAYYINYAQQWMDPFLAEGAIRAAAETWSAADPTVAFNYLGTSTDVPGSEDGHNVVGFFSGQTNVVAQALVWLGTDGSIAEADIALNSVFPWEWNACPQANASCTDPSSSAPVRRYDAQAIVTHELGHWLGLDEVEGSTDGEMTMYYKATPASRHQDTLALGDILGVRAAYPCSCGQATVYAP